MSCGCGFNGGNDGGNVAGANYNGYNNRGNDAGANFDRGNNNRGNVAGVADGCSGNYLGHLSNYIGQTVTIFTTSGGPSGSGFTGVLALVTPNFVRLITQIGSAPGCALGNCCSGIGQGYGNLGGQGRANCNGNSLGSVVDIPCWSIASFVHNAVGSGGY
jgi:hypothetical protein